MMIGTAGEFSMKTRTLAAVMAITALWVAAGSAAPEKRWFKGNLHTHTLNSDGDSTPSEVTAWYREHRYQFLVLTDHNYLTNIEGLNAVHGANDKFMLIPGEEVTTAFGKLPIHVNALGLASLVEPLKGASVTETIQNNVNAIREHKGIASLNHPNFGWAATSKDIAGVSNLGLFEVYNGHPEVNNNGGGGFESLDEMWDALLSAGKRMRGIAVDDAHHFKKFSKDSSNPGRGWVMVRGGELTKSEIMNSIAEGDFYASNGVTLADLSVSTAEIAIKTKPRTNEKFRTYFIGKGGKVLKIGTEDNPGYKMQGGEGYVRARIESSYGDAAWTQPVFP